MSVFNFLISFFKFSFTCSFPLCAVTIFFLISCSQQNVVEEYFQNHGMSYPVDVSGITLWSIEYAGIEEDELLVPGARGFVENGIIFAKEYFLNEEIQTHLPGAHAIVVSKPVLFRDESGDVGLMVKVIAYGEGEAGKAGNKIRRPIEWVRSDKRFWKIENFAYFNQDELYKWQYGGWVY